MGINDFEPRVINQMLEFSYRYVTGILEDARVYSSHARKKTLDTEDVKLAVQLAAEQGFTSPPPREALLELARAKNATQLPLIQPKAGVRLPPDRHCLTATNYKLKTRQRPSGFDYGGGGGGGLKPQYNRGKPGGAKTTVKNPNSFSVVGNSMKRVGRWGSKRLFIESKLLLRQRGRERTKITMPTESHCQFKFGVSFVLGNLTIVIA